MLLAAVGVRGQPVDVQHVRGRVDPRLIHNRPTQLEE